EREVPAPSRSRLVEPSTSRDREGADVSHAPRVTQPRTATAGHGRVFPLAVVAAVVWQAKRAGGGGVPPTPRLPTAGRECVGPRWRTRLARTRRRNAGGGRGPLDRIRRPGTHSRLGGFPQAAEDHRGGVAFPGPPPAAGQDRRPLRRARPELA